MDITTLKRKLEAFEFRPREGESWEFVWERQRELKPSRALFWRVLIRTLKKFLVKTCSVALTVGEKFALTLTFSPSGSLESVWIVFPEAPSELKPRIEEFDRRSPKGFVPLPDAEIGSCARNDSLIAPAI